MFLRSHGENVLRRYGNLIRWFVQAFPIGVKETRCPGCMGIMKIIAFIDNPNVIKKILKYLNLWKDESARDPPVLPDIPDEMVYVPVEDAAWEQHENPGLTA